MTISVKGGLTAEEIAKLAGGKLVNPGNVRINSITTDSRDVPRGALFIAIRGDRFDGNDYVVPAFENGAVCALAERVPENFPGCVIVVEDTKKALGILAKTYKEKINPLTVAVTGSVGKTTTKEFIYAVLSEKYHTLKTFGNYNNEIGLPMTLLGLSYENDAVVLEMGMSAAGEIEYLSRIAAPKIAVITNIGMSHIGKLGSREAIRDAKLEIVRGFGPDGVLILNGDEPLLAGIRGAVYVAVENKKSDCRIENITEGENGTAFDIVMNGERFESITIPTLGAHNALNAAYAWVVGRIAGLDEFEIRRGLKKFKNAAMRQNVYNSGGRIIMDDCYNASPESVNAALKVLADMAKRKHCRSVAVLGDMLELGDFSADAHKKVGAEVAAYDIDVLVTIGERAAEIAKAAVNFGMSIEDIYVFGPGESERLGKALNRITRSSDIILFKASRAVGLEKVISYMQR